MQIVKKNYSAQILFKRYIIKLQVIKINLNKINLPILKSKELVLKAF